MAKGLVENIACEGYLSHHIGDNQQLALASSR